MQLTIGKQAASDEQALLFLCKSLEAPGRPLGALKLGSVKTHSCYRLLEFAPARTGPRRICRDVLQVHVPATILAIRHKPRDLFRVPRKRGRRRGRGVRLGQALGERHILRDGWLLDAHVVVHEPFTISSQVVSWVMLVRPINALIAMPTVVTTHA